MILLRKLVSVSFSINFQMGLTSGIKLNVCRVKIAVVEIIDIDKGPWISAKLILQHALNLNLLFKLLQLLLNSNGLLFLPRPFQLAWGTHSIKVQLGVPLSIANGIPTLKDYKIRHQLRSFLFHALSLPLLNGGTYLLTDTLAAYLLGLRGLLKFLATIFA